MNSSVSWLAMCTSIWMARSLAKQDRRRVQIARDHALRGDIAVDALELIGREADPGRGLCRRDRMIARLQAGIHPRVGQREVELLLRLRQRVGVRRRRARADLRGDVE